MFFDKPWSEVTEKDISELAEKLSTQMGGWIFHRKVDFNNPTPYTKITKSQPRIMHGKAENISDNL